MSITPESANLASINLKMGDAIFKHMTSINSIPLPLVRIYRGAMTNPRGIMWELRDPD